MIPTATGVAVLKYRLYDIDQLINRTLVYGLLTALLGAIYGGVALLLGQLFGGIRRAAAELGSGRHDPGGRRAFPASPPPHPTGGRPALQPAPLQRRQDH